VFSPHAQASGLVLQGISRRRGHARRHGAGLQQWGRRAPCIRLSGRASDRFHAPPRTRVRSRCARRV